jgi:hypothetical protein
MARLLDPQHSLAVILGAHDWSRAGLGIAPSFRRSAAHFHAWLLRRPPDGLGLEPDFVVSLFDDPSPPSAQLERIRDTVRSLIRERISAGAPTRDLLIYYVGHGICESGRQLNLLVRHSAEGIEAQSSISASDLAQVLRVAAPQQRRLVILDCCFSEAAADGFGAMGALDEAVAASAVRDLVPHAAPPERGTLLLCSSPRSRFSIGRPDAARTLFTGALLSVLSEGAAWRKTELLSFAELREDIYDRMLRDSEVDDPPRPALHQPEQQDGDLTQLPAFPNAVSGLSAKADPPNSASANPSRPARRPAITGKQRRQRSSVSKDRSILLMDARKQLLAAIGKRAANPVAPFHEAPGSLPRNRDSDSHSGNVIAVAATSINELGQLSDELTGSGNPNPPPPVDERWRDIVLETVKTRTKVPTGGDIDQTNLSNAKSNFKIPSFEDIWALYDGTVFGSNKNGLAICKGGLYWKNSLSTCNFVAWHDLPKYKVRAGASFADARVYLNDQLWIACTQRRRLNPENLATVLRLLQEHPELPNLAAGVFPSS